jgi:hypothetical protein
MSYVKATMRVLVLDNSSSEYYEDLAYEIDVDDENNDFVSDEVELLKQEKRDLLQRAKELEREELPSVEELYDFLCDEGNDDARYMDMINCTLCWNTAPHSCKIYMEGENVMISFVADFEEAQPWNCTIEELEDIWNDEPFIKSRIGGQAGNYCIFPSRTNSSDRLCELSVDVSLVFVTDVTGNKEYCEESDEESDIEDLDVYDEEVKHPLYVRHESLDSVDLDDIEETPLVVKQTWSKRFVPKPIRSVLKRLRGI